MKYLEAIFKFLTGLFSDFDLKWVLKQGIGWSILIWVLWWVANNMILPMQTAHLELVREVAKNNTDIARSEDRQTTLIEEIRDLLKH